MEGNLSFKVAKTNPQNASVPRQGRSIRELWLEGTAKKVAMSEKNDLQRYRKQKNV
jgi:hypothetical protein